MKFNIDFVGKRWLFISLSIVLSIIAIFLMIFKGFDLGIEFSGGTELVVSTNKAIDAADAKAKLTQIKGDYATSKIVDLNTEVKTRYFKAITVKDSFKADQKTEFVKALTAKFSGYDMKVEQFNDVSGNAANEIKNFAVWAIVLSTIVLLAYIAFRFKLSFGVGAIIATLHDIVITLGLYSLFGVQIDVAAIASLLTLAGYSMNDTIVTYDRIRENFKKMRGKTIEEIVNTSINEVILRSFNTSFTTFIVVAIMLVMGGKSIASFAFGMTVGSIVGVYSSLYIAAPVVIGWLKKQKKVF